MMDVGETLQAFPGMKIYDLDTVFVACNETPKTHFSIAMDVVKHSNMASSRQELRLKDTVPPMHCQLFGAFTPQSRRIKSEFEYRMGYDAVQKPPKPAHRHSSSTAVPCTQCHTIHNDAAHTMPQHTHTRC